MINRHSNIKSNSAAGPAASNLAQVSELCTIILMVSANIAILYTHIYILRSVQSLELVECRLGDESDSRGKMFGILAVRCEKLSSGGR